MALVLSPKESVFVALGVAALIPTIYAQHLPSVAECRTVQPDDGVLAGAELGATILSAGLVLGVAAITSDPTVLVFGGLVVLYEAWMYRHANAYDSESESVLS